MVLLSFVDSLRTFINIIIKADNPHSFCKNTPIVTAFEISIKKHNDSATKIYSNGTQKKFYALCNNRCAAVCNYFMFLL